MKTGDPRQLKVLAVVAVLAIGFLALRLIPTPVPKALKVLVSQPTTVSEPEVDLPLTLVGNPFSHPRLAPAKNTGDARGEIEPLRLNGEISLTPQDLAQLPLAGDPQPEDDAGETRQQKQAVSRIELCAILRMEKSVALLSVNGGTPQEFSAGEQLSPGVRLAAIQDGKAVLDIAGEPVRLSLGEAWTGGEQSR